jgi:hypothetical protein
MRHPKTLYNGISLPDAIRAGSKDTDRCFGTWVEYDEYKNPIRACALGAAMLHLNIPQAERVIVQVYPELQKYLGESETPLLYEITHKNDTLQWRREQIADWLEAEIYEKDVV